MITRALSSFFGRMWLLYAVMAGALFFVFEPLGALDDVLNASRVGQEKIVAFAYGLQEIDPEQLSRSAGYYRILMSKNSWLALAQANLGFCNFYLRRVPQAVEAYEQAIKEDPGIYAFYFDLGFIMMSKGDYDKAVPLFEKARELFPKTPGAWLSILHLSPKYESHPLVQRDSVLFKRLEYDRRMLYVHLCSLYLRRGEHQKALALSQEALGIYADDPELFYYAAEANFHLKFIQEAVVLYSLAAKLTPDPKAWKRPKIMSDIHYWNDEVMFFQIYR